MPSANLSRSKSIISLTHCEKSYLYYQLLLRITVFVAGRRDVAAIVTVITRHAGVKIDLEITRKTVQLQIGECTATN